MTKQTGNPSRRAIITGAGACLVMGRFGAAPLMAQPADEDLTGGLYREVFQALNLNQVGQILLGRELEKRLIERAGGEYLNPSVQTAMDDFARPIFAGAANQQLSWRTTIVDNNTPAAWVLPGGHVVVHKGLLRYLDTPDELAAILAHEIGHAERGHLVEIMRRQEFLTWIPIDMMASLLAVVQNNPDRGILSPSALAILEKPIFDAIRAGYGPEREAAADQTIADVFARSGHDLDRGAGAFETIAALVPPGTAGTTCLYAAPDDTVRRVANLRARNQGAGDSAPPDPGFNIIKATFPTRRRYGYPNKRETTS